MMIVAGWKVIGNGHQLALHNQDATNPCYESRSGRDAFSQPRAKVEGFAAAEARQKTAFHGKARKRWHFRLLQLGGTTDLFHCVGAAQSRKREIFDEKQNADFAGVRVLTAFGGCRRLRIRPGLQVNALHWPDQ
jgi:hypothetical protein